MRLTITSREDTHPWSLSHLTLPAAVGEGVSVSWDLDHSHRDWREVNQLLGLPAQEEAGLTAHLPQGNTCLL